MTVIHAQTIWAMWREGLHQIASEAEAQWSRGEVFNLGRGAPVSKTVEDLIRRCNQQITKMGRSKRDSH